MSTDSYSVCPRCYKQAKERHAELTRQVEEAYGKAPPQAFDALRQAAQAADPKEWEEDENRWTLREYHEFLLPLGKDVLEISYHGACDDCDFELKFNHTKEFTP